jgi:hypothetical protein
MKLIEKGKQWKSYDVSQFLSFSKTLVSYFCIMCRYNFEFFASILFYALSLPDLNFFRPSPLTTVEEVVLEY